MGTLEGAEWKCALIGGPDRGDLIEGLAPDPIGLAGDEPECDG